MYYFCQSTVVEELCIEPKRPRGTDSPKGEAKASAPRSNVVTQHRDAEHAHPTFAQIHLPSLKVSY